MAEKEQLQEKFMEMQMVTQQQRQIEEQIKLIEQQLQEMESTKQALDDIKKTEKGTKILVPIANGMFTHATIDNTDEMIVAVGANTAVKKTNAETRQMFENQEKEVMQLLEQLHLNNEQLAKRSSELQQELQNPQ